MQLWDVYSHRYSNVVGNVILVGSLRLSQRASWRSSNSIEFTKMLHTHTHTHARARARARDGCVCVLVCACTRIYIYIYIETRLIGTLTAVK